MRPFFSIALFAFLAILCPSHSAEESGQVQINFTFNRQSGMSTNQFVVWVENENGELIRTIFITSFMTAKGGWQIRDDNLMLWHERSGVGQLPREITDAFTGATPSTSQPMEFIWDCRDGENNPVPPGRYQILVEGSMSSRSHVLFRIPITLGEGAAEWKGKPEFSGGGVVGRNMIEDVIITYRP